jgi:hypothetical protein
MRALPLPFTHATTRGVRNSAEDPYAPGDPLPVTRQRRARVPAFRDSGPRSRPQENGHAWPQPARRKRRWQSSPVKAGCASVGSRSRPESWPERTPQLTPRARPMAPSSEATDLAIPLRIRGSADATIPPTRPPISLTAPTKDGDRRRLIPGASPRLRVPYVTSVDG